jgi:transcriptional regulator with XRE-family HTH domain
MERDFQIDRQINRQIDWAEIVQEARRRRKAQGLTMRRLAAVANVSLPTVLRFEKSQRDIQLSSVLAILNALGMVARKVDGTLLVRGPADGPYQARFAPSAGAGGPLEIKNVEARPELEALFDELDIDTGRRRLALADLVRTEAASITGLRLSPGQARALWPEQFSRGRFTSAG